MSNGLVDYFGDLPDPRVRGRTDYPLIEIVFLCISAIVSRFDGWETIEDFGHGKLDWLRKLALKGNQSELQEMVSDFFSTASQLPNLGLWSWTN